MAQMDPAEASARSYRVPSQQPAATGAVQQNDTVHERSRLNPILTFDNFVTGKANQLARAAAVVLLELGVLAHVVEHVGVVRRRRPLAHRRRPTAPRRGPPGKESTKQFDPYQ